MKEKIIIAALVILLVIAGFLLIMGDRGKDDVTAGQTAVIEVDTETELTDTSGGQIRIRINPVVDISGGVMQNLNFANYNEERLLRCKILAGEEYVYDSGLIKSGDILKGDYIRTKSLASGKNEALAEIYSYDTADNLLGQTNVKIILNMQG